MRFALAILVVSMLPFTAGCQTDPSTKPAQPASSSAPAHAPQSIVAMPFHHPAPNLVTGGQPRPEDWLALRGRQVTTVINLRTDEEMGDRDEAAEVAAAGLTYEHLPIAGAEDINAANADELWQRIQAAPGRVMVHCASGNRVGALLAIAAVRHDNMSPQQALEIGKSAGLTRLEPRVREVLGLPTKP